MTNQRGKAHLEILAATAPLYPATMDEKHAFVQTRALFFSQSPLLPEIMSLYPSTRSRTRFGIVRILCWRLETESILAVFSFCL